MGKFFAYASTPIESAVSATPTWLTILVQVMLLAGVVAPLVLPYVMDRVRKRHGLSGSPAADSTAQLSRRVSQAGQDALSPMSDVMSLVTDQLERAEQRVSAAELRNRDYEDRRVKDAAHIARLEEQLADSLEDGEALKRQLEEVQRRRRPTREDKVDRHD